MATKLPYRHHACIIPKTFRATSSLPKRRSPTDRQRSSTCGPVYVSHLPHGSITPQNLHKSPSNPHMRPMTETRLRNVSRNSKREIVRLTQVHDSLSRVYIRWALCTTTLIVLPPRYDCRSVRVPKRGETEEIDEVYVPHINAQHYTVTSGQLSFQLNALSLSPGKRNVSL